MPLFGEISSLQWIQVQLEPIPVKQSLNAMGLFNTVLKIIRQEKKAPLASACLAFLSRLYRLGIVLRNFGYDRGILPSQQLEVVVVSIGNVAAGGTGKTPLTHLLAVSLQDRIKLGILSRGYRSKMAKQG